MVSLHATDFWFSFHHHLKNLCRKNNEELQEEDYILHSNWNLDWKSKLESRPLFTVHFENYFFFISPLWNLTYGHPWLQIIVPPPALYVYVDSVAKCKFILLVVPKNTLQNRILGINDGKIKLFFVATCFGKTRGLTE